MLFGIKFDDMPIRILLRYNVKPIGINTTTPVIKQFLRDSDKDFLLGFFVMDQLKLE